MAHKTKRQGAAKASTLPSKEEILEFIQNSSDRVGKREIARAFNIKGGERIPLKRLLREMAEEGLIAGTRKRLQRPGTLPPVTVITIVSRDEHGEFIAEPETWDKETHGSAPRILMAPDRKSRRKGPAVGIGDRVLARIAPLDNVDESGCSYEATIIKRLMHERARLLGIYRVVPNRGGVIDPIDKKQLREWPVPRGEQGDASDGELVRFEVVKAGGFGMAKARVLECLGNPDDQRATSLIAIHRYGIPDTFPSPVIKELEKLKPLSRTKREDLSKLPLVTIDPSDARDHDDAVWAAPDDNPKNVGGWIILVAIADVAHYVRPGTALDKEALKRGNSVYFPDQVVPMLPEKISNDLCSLREGELRPCLAVRMIFDKTGRKREHKFMRAMMRSAAKLSYEQAQTAIDGRPDKKSKPLLEPILKPLWKAYDLLKKGRDARKPLDLDLPERKILLNEEGQVAGIKIPERLDAHRLIEEFMIQANVATAETLEGKKGPVIYRVHDAPSKDKLQALSDFLLTLDIKLSKAGVLKPEHFNRILAKTRDGNIAELVSEVILRAQAQAEYCPDNYGHFGLNLRRYAHFTSPIRRYADLVVHRALINALHLGAGGISDDEVKQLDQISKMISDTERRAMAAERETIDRLISAYLADRIGATFQGRISGVTKSGLFIRLNDTGADGFVPASTLGTDYFAFDEKHHALVGVDTGEAYRLGDRVEARLVEAIPTAGALRFEILSDRRKQRPVRQERKRSHNKRPKYARRRR